MAAELSRGVIIGSGLALVAAGAATGWAALTLAASEEVKLFALFFSLPIAGFGAFRVVLGLLAAGPQVPIFAPEPPPAEERAAKLRQALPIFAVLVPLLSGLNAWQLYSGGQVWAPVAAAYHWLGFWPAMLVVPVLGGAALLAIWRGARRA